MKAVLPGIALAAEDLSGAKFATNDQAAVAKAKTLVEFRRKWDRKLIRARLRLSADRPLRENFDLSDRLESDRARRTRDHAFAALHAGRFSHRNVEIESDAGSRAFAGSPDDMVFAYIVTGAHATIAENAGGVIDEKDGRRRIEIAPAGERSRGRRRIRQNIELES